MGRSRGLVLSFLYWSLRRLLELVVLRSRSEREKEIEILLLRHQLQVLARLRRALQRHRPHRSLDQQPPAMQRTLTGERASRGEAIALDRFRRRDRLGGLLREYELAA